MPWSKSYHLALERPPDYGAIPHSELGEATPGKNAALGYIEGIHDGNDVIITGACSLDILDQFRCDKLVHVSPKVRGMQRDAPLEVVEEEHFGGSYGWRKVKGLI
jgi:hypothetical protein